MGFIEVLNIYFSLIESLMELHPDRIIYRSIEMLTKIRRSPA